MKKNKPDRILLHVLLILFVASIAGGTLFINGKTLLGSIFVIGSAAVLYVFALDWKEIHDPRARAQIKSTSPDPQYKSFTRFSTVMVVFGAVLMIALFSSGAYLAGLACGVTAAVYVAAIARS